MLLIKKLVILAILLLTGFYAFAQDPLVVTKKTSTQYVERIETAAERGDYEQAIILTDSKYYTVERKVISKKMLPLYDSLMVVCAEKREVFDRNRETVIEARKAMQAEAWERALSIVDTLHLDKSNAYQVSIDNREYCYNKASQMIAQKRAEEEQARKEAEEKAFWASIDAYDIVLGKNTAILYQVDFEEFLARKVNAKVEEVDAIKNLDVFAYFDVEGCNTELKRELYKETEEYTRQLEELKSLKKGLDRVVCCQQREGTFSLDNYNIKRDAFPIWIGNNTGTVFTSSWFYARPPKALSSSNPVVFKSLASVVVPSNNLQRTLYRDDKLTEEYLFVPMKRAKAAKLEGTNGCRLYILYIPGPEEEISFPFADLNNQTHTTSWYTFKGKVKTSSKYRVIVTDYDGNVLADF